MSTTNRLAVAVLNTVTGDSILLGEEVTKECVVAPIALVVWRSDLFFKASLSFFLLFDRACFLLLDS